ncbi:hypothetical protein E2C01_022438 [Portunus trituberculatus]|uniref:Uncharacterized protein n=1 Tax=Portunus trituberculatus TaxID=210409 RepID=A0A5B7E7P1_PORTR|nr:hypothetical protein [Portunus trituberculatus]
MISFPRLRDSGDFSPYSSSAEWADKDKMLLSGLLEADVKGPAVARSVCFNGLKKEDIEEGAAVAGSAGVTGTACLNGLKNEKMDFSSFSIIDFLINLDTFLYIMSHFATPDRIWVTFLQDFQSFFDTTETFSKSFDVQATHRFFFLVSLLFCLL